MFSTDVSELFLVLIEAPTNPGLLMTRAGDNVCVYSSLENARKTIQYDNDASSAIHLVSFRPCIVKFSAKTEKELHEAISPFIDVDAEGKIKISKLSNVAGSMTVVSTKLDADWSNHKVEHIRPIAVIGA